MAFIDITGNTYGRLTVLKESLPRAKPPKWVCQCSCGNTKVVIGASLKNGSTKSCGCLHIETNKKQFTVHGDYRDKLYAVYRSMVQRCTNPNSPVYIHYGGRGISFCPAWVDYSVFKEWALSQGYQDGLSLERVDNNKGYSPENCCWETKTQQARNRRAMKGFSSSYIGVHWDSARNKWMASIGINNKTIPLGRYATEHEAAQARDTYIHENQLKGFQLNFP